MGLLEDARRLSLSRIHEYRGDGLYSCPMCGWAATRADLDQPDMSRVHTSDCPWLVTPKIVAMVEARTRLSLWIRHHGDCEVQQRLSIHCTCGLQAALEEAYPDDFAEIRRRPEPST